MAILRPRAVVVEALVSFISPHFATGFRSQTTSSVVVTIKLKLPYEDTKRISNAKLFFLDDNWMNTNTLLGSLKKEQFLTNHGDGQLEKERTFS